MSSIRGMLAYTGTMLMGLIGRMPVTDKSLCDLEGHGGKFAIL